MVAWAGQFPVPDCRTRARVRIRSLLLVACYSVASRQSRLTTATSSSFKKDDDLNIKVRPTPQAGASIDPHCSVSCDALLKPEAKTRPLFVCLEVAGAGEERRRLAASGGVFHADLSAFAPHTDALEQTAVTTAKAGLAR